MVCQGLFAQGACLAPATAHVMMNGPVHKSTPQTACNMRTSSKLCLALPRLCMCVCMCLALPRLCVCVLSKPLLVLCVRTLVTQASLNWASMQRMAGDLAAAALSDLGWRERDETAED